MNIGILHSLIRPEEKLLIKEVKNRPELNLVMIDDRQVEFRLKDPHCSFDADVVLSRSINQSRSLTGILVLEGFGVQCVNTGKTATLCGDKIRTSVALRKAGIPQPEVRVAFSVESAIQAMEDMGFPVVLKPAVGSWGRLLSKINDVDTAYAILDHKQTLGGYQHSIYYIQKFIKKMGRDIRSIVIGDECIAASYRSSDHWITNAARGAVSLNCEVNNEIRDISLKAAEAVGGGIFGVDLFETDDGYLVNEINDTFEFKGNIAATGAEIPKKIVDYLISVYESSARTM